MIGKKLAQYEILEQLGQGGMGEVYKALDTKLNRHVAIKLIPDALAGETERLMRFEREAKLLASLNHPHIATLYDLEKDGDRHFIAMELIEGVDLSERIRSRPMAVDEALRIAGQVAEALEAAHEQGVVHRDLKPANIKLTEDGEVKVLDFGLAKATEGDPGDPNISQSPTMTAGGTSQGVILGTAAYMSPEQARGKPVDKRTDIWAFGCVLYDMLTGRQAFGGETVSDTIARILEREPDWAALPDQTPRRVRRVLERCLTKDVKRRLRDVADARVEIEDSLNDKQVSDMTSVSYSESQSGNRRWLGIGLAVGLVAGVVGALTLVPKQAPSPNDRLPARVSFKVHDGVLPRYYPGVSISPDGRIIAYSASVGRDQRLFVRDLESGASRAITPSGAGWAPFFSPDGKWIAYTRDSNPEGELVRVPIEGGTPRRVCDVDGITFGAWLPNGDIVVPRTLESGLHIVPSSGGEPRQLTRIDTLGGEFGHWLPHVLPDGDHILFGAWKTRLDDGLVKVVSVSSGEQKVLVEGGFAPMYAQTGHLVYVHGTSLLAAPFDTDRLEVVGEAVPVLDPARVSASIGRPEAVFSNDGTFVYLEGSTVEAQLMWLAMDGSVTPVVSDIRDYDSVRLNRRGDLAALAIDTGGESDVHVLDIATGAFTPVTFDGTNVAPIFTPDSRNVTFQTMRRGPFEVFTVSADGLGKAEPLFEIEAGEAWPSDWAPDGSAVVFGRWPSETSTDLLFYYPETQKIEMAVQTRSTDTRGMFSPDGKWLAHLTSISGMYEVFVTPLTDEGQRTRVTVGGADGPRWSPDGKALYYWVLDDLYKVPITLGEEPVIGEPEAVIQQHEIDGRIEAYDIHPDGDRFIVILNPHADDSIKLVMNWFTELKQRVPTGE